MPESSTPREPTSDPSSTPATLRVGLTGGIASGKSTVGKLMAKHGCTVTDADRLVAELYQPGEPGAQRVRELFGDELLDSRGGVDKDALGRLVFADADARRSLEREIHPLVGQRFVQLVSRSTGLVVFEATLLVETGGYRNFDALVTVEADEGVRLERAVERGLERSEAEKRIAAQTTTEKRREAADYVVENVGTLEDLEARVVEVVEALQARLHAAL